MNEFVDHKNKTVNVWWPQEPKPGNFGDILTPWLIQKLCGYKSTFQSKPISKPTLLGVGSIISQTTRHTTVWGSGLMKTETPSNPYANYLSVRGPITRDILIGRGIDCPDSFGDPALLMPIFYRPEVRKKYKIGIFAHYVDTEQVRKWYGRDSDILIINPLNADVTKVVDQVLKCDKIVSSSLHGIIISQAYGIPATWVKFSNKLVGDDTKFYDYYSHVGIEMGYTEFYEKIPKEKMELFKYEKGIEYNPLDIINAFPVRERK